MKLFEHNRLIKRIVRKIGEKIANRLISTSDIVNDSDSEVNEVNDQDTDSDAVECEESFCVLYFKNVYS